MSTEQKGNTTMDSTLTAAYLAERARGHVAHVAMSYARTAVAWAKVESGEEGGVMRGDPICYRDDGLVRLVMVPDEEMYDDSYLDDAIGYAIKDRIKRARKELWDTIARNGVWGLIGQWRATPDDEWETADSVWGIIPTNAELRRIERNPYARDMQRAALDALDYHRASEAEALGDRATYAAGEVSDERTTSAVDAAREFMANNAELMARLAR